GRSGDDGVVNGKNQLRSDLVEQTRACVGPYRLGVEVLDARVALVAPPDEVKDAFDGVAREQTRIATQRHQAEQEKEGQLRTAQADKYRTEQDTAAYVHGTRLLARREAERFTERLRQYERGRRGNPPHLRPVWGGGRGRA